MRTQGTDRSPDLEQLRLVLFPRLSREDGLRRIDAAFERAADPARAARVEQLARDPDLAEEMLSRVRRLGAAEST